MLAFSEILAAVEGLLRERFPGEAYYCQRAPADFARPSFLTELGPTEMLDASRGCVALQVTVKVTAFVTAGEHDNGNSGGLMGRLAAVQALFAAEGLRVADRVLRVTANKGNCQTDYAEVSITLQYQDDRPQAGRDWPLMGDLHLKVKEN